MDKYSIAKQFMDAALTAANEQNISNSDPLEVIIIT
jgi:hypothetical protein